MKSQLYHLQLNIDFESNSSFYKDLMEAMGWNLIFEDKNMMGYKTEESADLWFIDSDSKEKQDYDSVGVNHISIKVGELKNVDEITSQLEKNGIQMLFGTPKHRSDFAASEDDTYYQIMFESPDRILFEIVYVGPK